MGVVTDAVDLYHDRGSKRLLRVALEYSLLRSPVATSFSRRLYWRVAPRYHQWRFSSPEEFDAPLNPFKILWVSPDDITRISGRAYPQDRNAIHLFGTVRSGNWDQRDEVETWPDFDGTPASLYHADRFDETIIHRSLEQRFLEERPWSATAIVKRARELIEKDAGTWRGCETEAEIQERCVELDWLYENIRKNRYRTQIELIRRGEIRHVGFLDALANEILIDISRDGELLFANARHRLSIAKILGIDRIPVCVLVRHAEWMKTRDEVYRGVTDATNFDRHDDDVHPDLQDLVE